MSKQAELPNVVSFIPVVDIGVPHTDSDEIVIRVKDISVMYVRNGGCYIQADIWDIPWQCKVVDYDRIKRIFVEQQS